MAEEQKPIPFTREPAIQADIRKILRDALTNAEAGRLKGVFMVVLSDTEEYMSWNVAEFRHSMRGVVFAALIDDVVKERMT